MPDEQNINQRLKDIYGYSPLDGTKAKYRVVWSTGLTEKRHGTFNDYYGHIFVRSVVATREVPKYPYDKDRWVLERYIRTGDRPELDGTDHYEPMWTLKDAEGGFLPLNWKAIEIIVNALETPLKASPLAMLEEAEKKKDEAQLARDIDFIGDMMRSPYFGDLVE